MSRPSANAEHVQLIWLSYDICSYFVASPTVVIGRLSVRAYAYALHTILNIVMPQMPQDSLVRICRLIRY